MLSKRERLPVGRYFRGRGIFRRSTHCTLKIFPASGFYSRFGIAVSVSALPGSAARNRLKRFFFRFASRIKGDVELGDFLLSIAPGMRNISLGEFEQELEQLFLIKK